MGEEIRRECAERDEIRMGKIDLDEHAVDERQPQRHQDVEAAEDEAVDPLLQPQRQEVGQRLFQDPSGWVCT